MIAHRQIDQRNLAFGRAIAARLVAQPELIDHARANIARWLVTCSPGVEWICTVWHRRIARRKDELELFAQLHVLM